MVMYPLNYVKISVVSFAILIFTLCMQNSGENTADTLSETMISGIPCATKILFNLSIVTWELAWSTISTSNHFELVSTNT